MVHPSYVAYVFKNSEKNIMWWKPEDEHDDERTYIYILQLYTVLHNSPLHCYEWIKE